MKKLFTILSVLALLLVTSVFAAGNIVITQGSTPSAVNPDSRVDILFNLTNTDATVNISSVTLTSTNLVHTNGASSISVPTIAPTSLSNLNATAQTVKLTVAVPANTPAGVYKGNLTAYDTSNQSVNATAEYSITVNPYSALGFSTNEVRVYGSPGNEVRRAFVITNKGNTNLTNINISHNIPSLNDSDDNSIELSFNPSTVALLRPSETATIQAIADIDSGMEIKSFSGQIIVKATELSTPASANLIVKAQPVVCANGNVYTGNIDIKDIDSPNDGDDFDSGSEVPVRVTIKNRGSSDKRVKVEAYLFNDDKNKRVDYKYTDKKIDGGGEEETILLTLKMDNNLKEDDYKVYVKVYERGNEENHCHQKEVSIQNSVPDDKLQISSFSISPSILTCGDAAEALVMVKNLGAEDQSAVKVRLQNTYLGINLENTIPSIESGSSQNEEYTRFSFAMPKPTGTNYPKEGDYKLLATVTYAGGLKETSEATLSLQTCTPPAQTQQQQPAQQQNTQQTQPTPVVQTTAPSYSLQGVFDRFNTSLSVPTSVWLLVDVLLFVLIIAALVAILRPRH